MIDTLSMQKKYKAQLILFYWAKIVGDDIAAQSTPVNVEYHTLFLSVHNSVWCHHLSMMKVDMIFKVNTFIGEPLIKDIRFRNQPLNAQEKWIEPADKRINLDKELKNIHLDQQEKELAAQYCGQIQEAPLKKRLLQIYAKHLRFKKFKLLHDWHNCANCTTLCPKDQQYCNSCALEKRHVHLANIRKLLREVPWATYAEINQHIPCSIDAYTDAKVSLLNKIAGQINADDSSSLEVKTLAMLFTGARHDMLNDKLIQKTLSKFRRKTYVSASRR